MNGTLQSGFDAVELLARPSIQLVDSTMAKKAEQQIESCEHCHPDDAEIPFDWLLAEVDWQAWPLRVHLERTGAMPELPTCNRQEDAS